MVGTNRLLFSICVCTPEENHARYLYLISLTVYCATKSNITCGRFRVYCWVYLFLILRLQAVLFFSTKGLSLKGSDTCSAEGKSKVNDSSSKREVGFNADLRSKIVHILALPMVSQHVIQQWGVRSNSLSQFFCVIRER